VRWETERPFDDQLCHKYVYQKLLKLDNPSSSYGRKKFGVFFLPHSLVTPTQGKNVLQVAVCQNSRDGGKNLLFCKFLFCDILRDITQQLTKI